MAKGRGKEEGLVSLSEVARRTGISMPTLLRYKKVFSSEIPSVGEGRSQRYPKEAVAVFARIKEEGAGRRKRGSARGRGAVRGRKPAAGAAASGGAGGDLLSLSEVGRLTGISYPTLLRYVKLHLNEIPHSGSGRTRRFRTDAVEVFARLRRESRRGRRPSVERMGLGESSASGIVRRLDRLERQQSEIARQLRSLMKGLERPIRVVVQR
jgi:DNA-binding transcriptional MerR regulator